MRVRPGALPRFAVAVSFAALSVACAGVSSQAPPPMAPPPAGRAVAQPVPGLYVTGQPAEDDWRGFAEGGVATVINLRTATEMAGRDERAEVVATGMRYLELPIDGAAAVTPENARRLGALLRDARGPVLLHCASGNRAGGLLALLKVGEGMPVEQALAIGRSAGMTSIEATVRETLRAPPAGDAP